MNDSILVNVKVFANAPFDRIEGWEGDWLKIRIHAAPEKGKANEYLIRFLAKCLNISPRQIAVAKGASSRLKQLKIEGMNKQELLERLLALQ